MKFRKEVKKFCKHCKKHTLHKVKQEKNRGKNKTHPLTRGARIRMRRRGKDRGMGNQGSTSRPAITKWKMSGKKRTKKTDLRFTCSVCRKTSVSGNPGFRVSKIVFE